MKTNKDIPYRRFTRKIIKHVYFFLIHSWLSSIQSLSNKAKVVSNVLSPCQMNVLLLWWLFLFFWNKRILFFHIVHVRHHYKPIICSILNMNNKKKWKRNRSANDWSDCLCWITQFLYSYHRIMIHQFFRPFVICTQYLVNDDGSLL